MSAAVLIALILCSPSTLRDADRLVQEATVDYNASDFDGALAKLTEAYKLKPDPALLFDIAQCYRALHRWERAEFTYQAYLKERPDAPDRKKVKGLIAKVRAEREREEAEAAQLAKQSEAQKPEVDIAPQPASSLPAVPTLTGASAAVPAAPAASLAEPIHKSDGRRAKIPVVSWILGGVGAAALIAGGGFGIADAQIAGQNHPVIGSDGLPLNTITYGQFQSAQRDAIAADVGFISGGVLLVTAIVWALVAPARGDSTLWWHQWSDLLTPRPSLAGLVLAVAACSISSSLAGHYACSADSDCPSGQVCMGANCFEPSVADAGSDGGVDGGPDAGADAGADGGRDAGLDAGSDAGLDGGRDAGSDGGTADAGVPDGGPPDSGLPNIVCDFGSDGGAVDGGDAGVDAGVPDAGPSPYALALVANVDQWAGQNAALQVTATMNGQPVANQEVDAYALSYACQPIVESVGTTDASGMVSFSITLLAQAPPGPYLVATILKVGGTAVATAQEVVLVSDYTSPNSAVWSTTSTGTTLTGGSPVATNGYPVVVASPQPPTGTDYSVFALISDITGGAAEFGLLFRINPDNSALLFAVDFPGDGGATLAFSDFPAGEWSPNIPSASIPMPISIESETVYGLLVQVQGDTMSGKVWNTLGPPPSSWQVIGTVPDGFFSGTGIGFYSYGDPAPPNVQIQQLTAE